jgi:hypothetical protein
MSEADEKRTVSRARKWALRSLAIAGGLVAGLALTEAIFWWRDDGGFPHVNFYVPDETLGVRLEPGAEMRLAFRDNPVTDIRVNAQGYRGADWGAPAEGEILVVGDSQVFGLGVNDAETFSSVLAEETGRPVLNAGVPTYGPLELEAIVRELLPERRVRTVVYVLNMANDWFEKDSPNTERHVVWDGWAVRPETAPETITEFPGRELLFRRSHAFYALRRVLWDWSHADTESAQSGIGPTDPLFRGSVDDLVALQRDTSTAQHDADDEFAREVVAQRRQMDALAVALDATEDQIDQRLYERVPELSHGYGDDGLRYRAARGNPGDIVEDEDVEEGTAIALTTRIIRQAVVLRQRLEDRETRSPGSDGLAELIDRRDTLTERRESLRGTRVMRRFTASVLEPRLRAMDEIVREAGAELVVVALPLDVQVSHDEWAKYPEAEPIDMEPTRVLLTDVVRTAERMGARAIDLTDALRGAEPDAFLDGDIHMTAKGHRAVGEALAALLEAPPPLRDPEPGLPEGRSRVPEPDQWLRTREAIVRGSSRASCETVLYREWLRVSCRKEARNVPTGVDLVSGGRGEAMIVRTEEASTIVVPILEGDEVLADFHWRDRTQRLVLRWRSGGEREMFFEDATEARQSELATTEREQRLCACHAEVEGERVCRLIDGWPTDECTPSCASLYGQPTDACFEAYADNCAALLRCVQGDPASAPPCPAGQANAGGTGHCFTLCDEARPCPEGNTCEPWMGAAVCVPRGS